MSLFFSFENVERKYEFDVMEIRENKYSYYEINTYKIIYLGG